MEFNLKEMGLNFKTIVRITIKETSRIKRKTEP